MSNGQQRLFWACFIALIATAFGFIVRTQVIDEWGTLFGLTQTQKGELFGVGLWPFAVSIVIWSLFIDRVGYGVAMVFAFVCHVLSAIITISAEPLAQIVMNTFGMSQSQAGYWVLYFGTFIVALANGTVEAVINPVVATLYPREKTKWLNILHAGWPGGLVLGGILAIAMGGFDWKYRVALILLPTIAYGVMMIGRQFPVSERVAAGVSYRDMLREFGALGALIVSWMIVYEVGRIVYSALGADTTAALASSLGPHWQHYINIGVIALITAGFGIYTASLGRPLFIFMLLIMVPLATTELGTDSWITELMEPAMKDIGIAAGWVLVYTSFIMMVLRFFAGAIVHRLSPLGLLAVSAAVAAVGLVFLSQAEAAILILLAATVYGFGKTFFWPTMLGVVAEQSPKGGALTLNATGGVGMLGVGVVGAVFLGLIQDTTVERSVEANLPEVHSQITVEKPWLLGTYEAVDPDAAKAANLSETQQEKLDEITADAKQSALWKVAIFPVIMLLCYLGLIVYFRSKGGYQAQVLTGHAAEDKKFTGGVEGPADH